MAVRNIKAIQSRKMMSLPIHSLLKHNIFAVSRAILYSVSNKIQLDLKKRNKQNIIKASVV